MKEIKKMLTTQNYNEGNVSRIKYIVIHYVGAEGSAKSNCNYFMTYRGSSAHYFVDHNGDIYQSIEDKNVAWHCRAKVYKHPECRNANSIGVELCCRKGSEWYFEEATVASAIELTKYLMKKYNISADNVVRHYDVTGKDCPNPFVKHFDQWAYFKAQITSSDVIADGWQKINGKWVFYSNGARLTGWQLLNHYWNYFDTNGHLLTGWQKIDGRWAYLEEDGDYEGCMWHEAKDGKGYLERWYVD